MIDIKDNINILKGVGEKTLAKFNDANIFSIKDLLLYAPKKYDILDVLEPNLQTDGLDLSSMVIFHHKLFQEKFVILLIISFSIFKLKQRMLKC